jgi:hypothetical protein
MCARFVFTQQQPTPMQARFTAEVEIIVWIAGPEETKKPAGKVLRLLQIR